MTPISGQVILRLLRNWTVSPASIAAPISPTSANLSASRKPDRPGMRTSQEYGIRSDTTTGFHTPPAGPPLYTTFVAARWFIKGRYCVQKCPYTFPGR